MNRHTIKELENIYPHLTAIEDKIELLKILLDKLINSQINGQIKNLP